jgi:hypothetical protein
MLVGIPRDRSITSSENPPLRALLLPLIFLSIILLQLTYAQDLKLVLKMDSDTYLESQEVWAHVVVVNQSMQSQRVSRIMLAESELWFKLCDEKGKTTEPHFNITYCFQQEPSLVLEPADSLSNDLEILMLVANKHLDRAEYLNSTTYLTEGRYTIQAKTHPFSSPVKDTLVSNTVKFKVTIPAGAELKALELLREADQTYLRDLQKNRQGVASAYEDVLATFPKSRYAPYVYRQLIFLYHDTSLHNDQKLGMFVTKLTEDFPDNSRAVRGLSMYVNSPSMKGNKNALLKKLTRDHPNSKVGRFSKQKLLELRKKTSIAG